MLLLLVALAPPSETVFVSLLLVLPRVCPLFAREHLVASIVGWIGVMGVERKRLI